MYLFLFADASVLVIHDNLSIADILAIKEGTLRVFKIEVEPLEVLWTPDKIMVARIREGKIVGNLEKRIHHP